MTVPPMIELQNAWPAAPLAAGRYKMIWDSLCESGEQQSLTHVRGDRRGAVLRIVHTSAVSIWSKESQALSKIRLISWASLLKLYAANWIVSMIFHCQVGNARCNAGERRPGLAHKHLFLGLHTKSNLCEPSHDFFYIRIF